MRRIHFRFCVFRITSVWFTYRSLYCLFAVRVHFNARLNIMYILSMLISIQRKQTLMWSVSVSSFLLGVGSMLMLRHWASLVTNRELLGNLLRVYITAFFIEFGIGLWLLCCFFKTYQGLDYKVHFVPLGVLSMQNSRHNFPKMITCTIFFIF